MTDFLTHQEQLTIDLKQALQLARRYPDNQNLLDFCSHLQNQLDVGICDKWILNCSGC